MLVLPGYNFTTWANILIMAFYKKRVYNIFLGIIYLYNIYTP